MKIISSLREVMRSYRPPFRPRPSKLASSGAVLNAAKRTLNELCDTVRASQVTRHGQLCPLKILRTMHRSSRACQGALLWRRPSRTSSPTDSFWMSCDSSASKFSSRTPHARLRFDERALLERIPLLSLSSVDWSRKIACAEP